VRQSKTLEEEEEEEEEEEDEARMRYRSYTYRTILVTQQESERSTPSFLPLYDSTLWLLLLQLNPFLPFAPPASRASLPQTCNSPTKGHWVEPSFGVL